MAIDSVNLKNHAEFLNKAFKTNFKTFTKSRYSLSDDFWLWFINSDLKKNNGWEIVITEDAVSEEYINKDKRPPYYDFFRDEKAYRIIVLFEENEYGNKYRILGLYEYDFENSDEYNSIHKFIKCKTTEDISENIRRYIDRRYSRCIYSASNTPREVSDPPKKDFAAAPYIGQPQIKSDTIIEALKNMDKGFSDTLLYYIDKKGITDVECYKQANVDRKIFSKIKCNQDYRPSKSTAIAFAIALKLDINETNHLLRTLGYLLSNSNKFDIIVGYCIKEQLYDVNIINMILLDFDQPLLGY